MVEIRNETGIIGLGIKVVPDIGFGSRAVKNRQAGKILHPQNKGQMLSGRHNHDIGDKTGFFNKLIPAKLPFSGMSKYAVSGQPQGFSSLKKPGSPVHNNLSMPSRPLPNVKGLNY